MKRILFVIPFLSSGGAERVVSIWTSELAKINADVHLLLLYRVENEYSLNENVVIHSVKEKKTDYDKLSKIDKIRFFRNKLKEINPDIVVPFITYIGSMVLLCRLGLKYKIIETIRIDPRYSPKSKKSRLLRNFSVAVSKRCIVQNKNQLEYFPKFMRNKIEIFPNPIANEFLIEEKKFKEKRIKNIVSVGRLEKQKNYKMLLDAFKRISLDNNDVYLDIYGEGSLYLELKEYISKLELENRVFLRGRTKDIKSVLIKSDMYILSSDAEGMPNSLMEAMAVGLPCISTDCPTGPSDLIKNGVNGVLIPVGDVERLEKEMSRMIKNIDNSIGMGQAARESIKKRYGARSSAINLKNYIESIR